MRPRMPLACLCACALGLAVPAAASELVDGVAAQVGNEIVLVSEVTQYTQAVEKEIRAAGATDADVRQMKAEVLERLIERKLIDQMVKRAELEATDAEVDQAVAAIASENGLTVEELHQSVKDSGMPIPVYREKLRGEIQHAKVMNGMVRSRVRVDESEVQKLYEQRYSGAPSGGVEYHLRHILLPFTSAKPGERAGVCARAKEARERIVAGAPFEVVAREVSAFNPEVGGDVGWVHQSSLASWMASTVRSLEPGQVSGVVESSFGCNLIQMVEKREFEQKGYQAVRDDLYEEVFRQKMEVEYGRWIDKLRDTAYIERKGVFATAGRPSTMPSTSVGREFGAP